MKKTTCALLFCLLPLSDTLKASEEQAQNGHWRVIKGTDLFTLEEIYRADLDGVIQGESRNKKKISLTVRCQKGKKAQLMINWHRFLGDKAVAVSHSIDGEPGKSLLWDVIGERTTTSLPAGSIALFMQRLQDGSTLDVHVAPWRGQPINAVFHLNGAESALADIRKDCH